ncbi:MAG: hypothetical protein RO257_11735 [Candidatus Kapabacteria bacterium]|nr:hypothetical protein [Candidatus Kapabacteria bacterium]
MKIEIDRFKLIVNQLFEFLDENEISSIEIEEDYYWNIEDYEVKYNPEIEPINLIKEFCLGSLYDEWEFIQDIAEREKYQIISSVTFSEVAEILKYIGFKSINLIKDIE